MTMALGEMCIRDSGRSVYGVPIDARVNFPPAARRFAVLRGWPAITNFAPDDAFAFALSVKSLYEISQRIRIEMAQPERFGHLPGTVAAASHDGHTV